MSAHAEMPETATASGSPEAVALPDRIVLFDGVCNVCNASVDWLLRHDAEGRYHVGALQGETAKALRSRHAEIPQDIDTIVLVERVGGREQLYLRSRAIFCILRDMDSALRHFAVLRFLPAWLTDLGYRAFAALRYRLFGKRETCRLPTPDERARFVD